MSRTFEALKGKQVNIDGIAYDANSLLKGFDIAKRSVFGIQGTVIQDRLLSQVRDNLNEKKNSLTIDIFECAG